MRHGLNVLFGFLVGLALGCESKPREVSSGSGRGAEPVPNLANSPKTVKKEDAEPAPNLVDPPKTVKKEELAAEVKLATLEKTVALKEKELADLKAEMEALRKTIAAAKAPKDKVYSKPEDLFADMPKAAFPKFGAIGGVERAAASKWMKDNLVGRGVEWRVKITKAADSGEGPFRVTLDHNEFRVFNWGRSDELCTPFGEGFTLGDQVCAIALKLPALSISTNDSFGGLEYPKCTAEEAKKLRGLEGQQVVLRATITGVEVYGANNYSDRTMDGNGTFLHERVLMIFSVSRPSANGILPVADRLKPKADLPKKNDKKK